MNLGVLHNGLALKSLELISMDSTVASAMHGCRPLMGLFCNCLLPFQPFFLKLALIPMKHSASIWTDILRCVRLVACVAVWNHILVNKSCFAHCLLLAFPSKCELTNVVTVPNAGFSGNIAPKIMPVEIQNEVNSQRDVGAIEIDIAFAVTVVKSEHCCAVNMANDNQFANQIDLAMEGVDFNDDEWICSEMCRQQDCLLTLLHLFGPSKLCHSLLSPIGSSPHAASL